MDKRRRYPRWSKVFLAALALAACEAVPNARPVLPGSPEVRRVKEALADWPRPAPGAALRRPFFAEIDAAGRRITAKGVLEYHGPRDFRVTTVAEDGSILFDGRVNWAGAMILRQTPGIDTAVVEALLADLTRAFDPPVELRGLKTGDEKMVLARRLGDDHDHTWIFSRGDGRLLETTVTQGLDTLHVAYGGYSARGWPEELRVTHWTRRYEVSFSFTGGGVVGTAAGI